LKKAGRSHGQITGPLLGLRWGGIWSLRSSRQGQGELWATVEAAADNGDKCHPWKLSPDSHFAPGLKWINWVS
jgi:hypothetical protein